MLFRPFRLMIVITIAFLSGAVYERLNAKETCAEYDGIWDLGVCFTAEVTR
ncbi:MAG: hypothetical protein OEZ19_05110 [Paracoccaceae bacterium]|nr:hypothetical protein [Paracoccaceae bacterium]